MENQSPKVVVLLSAYNGEKYICEQIDSILSQTYKNIEILVRDDGSKDGTVEVLQPYVKANQIKLEKGENVGFVKSFFWLVEHAPKADYYAFSDQDDVWFEDKIEIAVERLKDEPADIPLLYYTNYDLYDGDLNFKEHRSIKEPKTCFRNSLVDCVPLGFNTLFNEKARSLVVSHMPQKSLGHDWTMYMVCAGMGKLVYEARPTVKYRRHDYNVSNAGDSFIRQQIWRFKKFFLGGYFRKVHEQIQEFEQLFGDSLSTENQKILHMFAMDGFHPVNILKKVFYPKYYRQTFIDDMLVRCIMLIGRL